jgi:hypothetical protein
MMSSFEQRNESEDEESQEQDDTDEANLFKRLELLEGRGCSVSYASSSSLSFPVPSSAALRIVMYMSH